ncbi:MAG: BPSS1780 family membrane protein [Pseudomonadota bacterium]
MNYHKREGNHGLQWFKCGWGLFKESAVTWVLIGVVFMLAAILVSLVPLVGGALFMVAMPVLIGGYYLMASGEKAAEISGLFTLFNDEKRRNPLLVLGGILLVVSFIATMILGGAIFGSAADLVTGAEPDVEEVMAAVFSPLSLVALLLVLVVELLLAFGIVFGVGLVVFQDAGPRDAFVHGIKAGLGNLWPLTLFGLIYLLLAILAAIPLGLGYLVLMPVTLLAGYCAYRDLFEATASPRDAGLPHD